MSNIPKINLEDYTYDLPDEKIALYPLENRDNSKLMIVDRGSKSVKEKKFYDLPEILDENFHLVFNNTKVIPARFYLKRENEKVVEIFSLNPVEPSSDPQIALIAKNTVVWNCLIRGKRIKVGEILINPFSEVESFKAEILEKGENFKIKFTWDENISFFEILNKLGNIPLPPYIKRDLEESDKERYQTIFAKNDGSVAAPTAALHFTEKVMSDLKSKNIDFTELVLHVGAGTFKPLSADKIEDHLMHQEFFSISRESLVELLKAVEHNKKILAVGTTSIRTLESIMVFANKLLQNYTGNIFINQWESYDLFEHDKIKLLNLLIEYLDKNNLTHLTGETQLIIVPGYKFRIVDGIITNFHQPKSTLILLVAAFMGRDLWQKSYNYALENQFRFLSYGDSSVII